MFLESNCKGKCVFKVGYGSGYSCGLKGKVVFWGVNRIWFLFMCYLFGSYERYIGEVIESSWG